MSAPAEPAPAAPLPRALPTEAGPPTKAALPTEAALPGPAATGPVPPRRPRLRALDGLRLLAALMVACYHYGGRGGDITRAWGASPAAQFPRLHEWFAYGPLGVQIFFVISGFVICMSGWGRGLTDFFASRVARLMPTYWAAILLVSGVFALPWVLWHALSPSDTLLNLTLLQMPLGAPRVLGVCWTLWAEVRFYALFAVCVVLPGVTRRRVVLFCALWTLAAALGDAADSALLDQVLMPRYAPFFVGGIGLYLVHRDRRDVLGWGFALLGLLLGQHYAVGDLWHPDGPGAFSYRSTVVIIALVTLGFAAVAAIAVGWLDRVDWRWLTVAGALTYPFYLVHEHLGWVVVHALHVSLGVPAAVTFPATIGAMLLLAWLLHRCVERPLTPKLRRAVARGAAGTRTGH
ncbi:acyltransferase family protein [Streptomyces sp. NRRL F-5630]|uniref:acyltransferase family protein n=1 Tax=Streptomyces sp. NRRL F-5630 TaxID=1463864 RepID=UPI003D718A67